MRDFNRFLALGALCAGMALLSLTGCASSRSKLAQETGRTKDQVKTDEAISDQVKEALAVAPAYKYPQVTVDTYKGQIALSGFVQTDGQKQEATRIAEQFAHGNAVHNNLVLHPLTPTGRPNQGGQGQNQGQQPQNQDQQGQKPAQGQQQSQGSQNQENQQPNQNQGGSQQ